jgi:MarR family transcriptional regulator for hemolysin
VAPRNEERRPADCAAADPSAEESPVPQTFGFLVHDVGRLLKRHFERRARDTGLPITRRQAAIMLYVSRRQGVSQAEVASRLDIEPIALVRMLDKLSEGGLVERRAHPRDRRVRALWLTPSARPVVEQILRINEAIRSEAFVGFSHDGRERLVTALALVKKNLGCDEAAAKPASEPAEP